jgi:hypothetical protein
MILIPFFFGNDINDAPISCNDTNATRERERERAVLAQGSAFLCGARHKPQFTKHQ